MDLIEYYSYGYKISKVPFDLIYLLYVKIWVS